MKQEQKNKALAISLVVLLTITVGLFWLQGKRDEIDKDLFRVPQLSDVDGISLRSRENQVLLSYEGSRWRVNNLYDADNQMITVLFATLQQVEPKRKVSALLADSVASVLQNLGVRISLFQGESMVGEFYVGGNKSKTEAYFMSEDNEPYVVTIPGYRVYAAGVFELGENGWRDKRIFNFNWRNFKRLEAQFRQQPDQSFSIEDLGSGFGLVNAPPSDTTKLNDYLDAVSLLVAQQFTSPGINPSYDSLLKTAPSVTLSVFDLGENVRRLELYRPLVNDPNVLGRIGENDAVLFSREQVLPVLKSKDYFKITQP